MPARGAACSSVASSLLSMTFKFGNASSNGFSFVISYESRSGPGLHGNPGYVVSWRPVDKNRSAIKVGGSPFKTLIEAEKACEIVLEYLKRNS
jgi:hypothetical protein